MPFDTISGPKRPTDKQLQQTAIIFAYHSEKTTIQKRLSSGFSYVSENWLKRIEIKPSGLSTIVATVSALTVLSLFSTPMIVGKTYATSNANSKSNNSAAHLKPNVSIPPIVNFQGLEIASLKPLTLGETAFGTRTVPRPVQRGGFESVYVQAGSKYGVPWQILAAVHYVETGQSGDTDKTSKAGALGPMQFMQSTFDVYQQDGDGDGTASIYDVHDAIFTAAKQLAANGAASGNVRQALFNYNHNQGYVDRVLNYAASLGYSL